MFLSTKAMNWETHSIWRDVKSNPFQAVFRGDILVVSGILSYFWSLQQLSLYWWAFYVQRAWWDGRQLLQMGLCKVRMRTADADGGRRMRTSDNYKIRKIRNDRSFSSFNLRTIACNLYPCELVLIQKWQVPKHLDLKGRLISGTLCKTNLGFLNLNL